MKRILLITIAAIFAARATYAVILRYDDTPGKKYRLKATIEQDIYVDGYHYASREGMYKTTLALTGYSNSYAQWAGEYYYFSHDTDSSSALKLSSYYQTVFLRNQYGDMIISPEYYMPAIRGVPAFPDYNVEIGDSWTATGEEYHEPIAGGFNPIRFNMNVRYRLLDIISNDGKSLAAISVDYHVMHFPPADPNILSFTGYSHAMYYWDIENGMRDYSEEEFTFMATLHSGESILYNGWSETFVDDVTHLTNAYDERIMELLTASFSEDSGVDIDTDDDGIIINLNNILFDFDKATLRESAEETLEQIAAIIRQYPDLDIELTGYTDSIGDEDYNLLLSESRALSVTEFLLDEGIASDRMAYHGLGSADPVADNSTAEGRALNRRVELKIITSE